ncbi:MAG: hypothetical protein AAGL17_20115, partial [Cyanobacteria bacterium J06576_12]
MQKKCELTRSTNAACDTCFTDSRCSKFSHMENYDCRLTCKKEDKPKADSMLGISVLSISQATTATFTELYFQHTFLFFIQAGSKRVLCPINGELIGDAEDVMVFPPGAIVTMENRPVLGNDYRATGVCFPHRMIETVFSQGKSNLEPTGIQLLQDSEGQSLQILNAVQATLKDTALPDP